MPPPISGATQNIHNCWSAMPPTSSAGPVLRAGFTDVLVTGMLIEVDQGQPKADRNWSEPDGRARIGRAEDDEQEAAG